MNKFLRKIKEMKTTSWLWIGLIALLIVSAIIGLTIWLHANGWTWMVVFGNPWFIFFSIALAIVVLILAVMHFKNKNKV